MCQTMCQPKLQMTWNPTPCLSFVQNPTRRQKVCSRNWLRKIPGSSQSVPVPPSSTKGVAILKRCRALGAPPMQFASVLAMRGAPPSPRTAWCLPPPRGAHRPIQGQSTGPCRSCCMRTSTRRRTIWRWRPIEICVAPLRRVHPRAFAEQTPRRSSAPPAPPLSSVVHSHLHLLLYCFHLQFRWRWTRRRLALKPSSARQAGATRCRGPTGWEVDA